jgi:hypothetical protein
LDKALRAIERNALNQARMIEDLLDVSRIITGKFEFAPERLDICKVVEAAANSMRPKAAEKNLTLTVQVSDEPVWVIGVRARLEQVIWSLVSNSIKFTPFGGDIAVSQHETGNDAVISVRDTGIGIPSEFLPRVFDRFSQSEGFPVRRHDGLGIGLSLVHAFVELHKGRVWAESPGLGQGATFHFSVPKTTGSESVSVKTSTAQHAHGL